MFRLIVVLILFFVSLPSRLFSAAPSAQRRRTTSPLNRIFHLGEAFSTFDRTTATSHYWRSAIEELRAESADGSGEDEDVELRPYLFRTSDENESLSDDEFQTSRGRRRGLFSSSIDQLPLMYYSKFVFPRALRSKDSLGRALAKIGNVENGSVGGVGGSGVKDVDGYSSARESSLSTVKYSGTFENPIDLTQTIPNTKETPDLPTERRNPASVFCSFFPRVLRSRETEFLATNSTGRSRLSSRPAVRQPSASPSRQSAVPTWRRLKVCFGTQ